VYAGGATTQKVWKLQKSDLVKVAESVDFGGYIMAIGQDETFIFIGGYGLWKVWKLQKSDLVKVAESVSYNGFIQGIEAES